MSKYANIKKKFKFDDGYSSALKKSVKSIKKTKTDSFLNHSSQICAISKMDIVLETFGPSEINQ